MKTRLLRWIGIHIGIAFVPCVTARAITVQETGVGMNEIVQIQVTQLSTTPVYVYAGVVELSVNHQAKQGFCIDPFHWSSGQAIKDYSYASLANIKAIQGKPDVELNASQVSTLSRLWSTYYGDAQKDASTAAGLQIAIWELVAGHSFALAGSSIDYGAANMLAVVQSSTYRGRETSLVALRGPASGQDYVVQAPDGGTTVALLGLTMVALIALRAKLIVA